MSKEPIDTAVRAPSPQRLRVLLMAGSMEAGGSERQTLLLLRHLDRRAIQPVLFLTHRRGRLLPEVPDDVKILARDSGELAKSERRRWTDGLNWPGRRLQQQTRFLAECIVRERIDVIYDRTFHMSMLAGPAAERTGVPHLSTVVSLPERAFPLLERRFRWWKKQRLVRAYRTAARIIAVSDAAADSAIAFYGLSRTSVSTIRNPVDRERLLAEAKHWVDWAPAADRLNLVCVGRMSEEKGHADLFQALSRIEKKNWQLWLLGDGPLRGSLEAMARKLELADQIHFLGHLDQAAAVISKCQLLVSPSHYEGMPNVVLEAMMLGVPVIATDAGGTTELIQQGRFGTLVPTANPSALADAIASFLRGPEPYRKCAQQAQAEVFREHSVEKIVPRIEAVLREAARSGQR